MAQATSLTLADLDRALEAVDPITWAENHCRLDGRPWNLDVAPWWREPLEDFNRNYTEAIFYCSRKVFKTTTLTILMFCFLATHPNVAAAWLLPRWIPQASNYSRQVVNPLLASSGLQDRLIGRGDVRAKSFRGDSPDDLRHFYIFGVHGGGQEDDMASAVRSAILDYLNYDERQQMTADTEDVASGALMRSKYKLSTASGTPNNPAGILDDLWRESDQREWFIACPDCDHEQRLTERSIISPEKAEPYFGCIECGAELDRSNGRWVSQCPKYSNFRRGYHMYQAMLLDVTAAQILRLKRKMKTKAKYYQEVWGQSYADVTNQPFPPGCFEASKDHDLEIGLLPEGMVSRKLCAGVDPGDPTYCWVESDCGEKRVLRDFFGVGRVMDCPWIIYTDDPRRHLLLLAEHLVHLGFGRGDAVMVDWGYAVGRAADLRAGLDSEVWECRYVSNPDYRSPDEGVRCPVKNTMVTQRYCNEECPVTDCPLKGMGQRIYFDQLTRLVKVDKTWIIKQLSDDFYDGEIILPYADSTRISPALEMFHSLIPEERTSPSTRTKWTVFGKIPGKPDHAAHCAVYAKLAGMAPRRPAPGPMMIVGAGDRIGR